MTDQERADTPDAAPADATAERSAIAATPLRVTPPAPFDADDTHAVADNESADDAHAGLDADVESRDAEGEDVAEPMDPETPAPFEDLAELPALLEALLFVADHPVDSSYLSRAVELSAARVEQALDTLAESLRMSGRGIRLQRGPAGAQLVSAPEAAARVEHFLGLEANRRLSTASLETLAIIAYRQPITRGQVDGVRGVSSDGAIATLRARELIEPAGHAPGPGRPMLFRTTQRFLEHFGLERPGQLPPLPEDIDLPPGEIGEQLGLDEATIAEALRPRDPEPPVDADDTGSADEPSADLAATALDEGEPAAEHAAEPATNEAGERDDDAGRGDDELDDDDLIAAALAAGSDLDLPSDPRALSEAAEHAFEASRERRGADTSDDEPPA